MVLPHLAGYPPEPSSELMDAVDFALRRMAAWLLTVCTTLMFHCCCAAALQRLLFHANAALLQHALLLKFVEAVDVMLSAGVSRVTAVPSTRQRTAEQSAQQP